MTAETNLDIALRKWFAAEKAFRAAAEAQSHHYDQTGDPGAHMVRAMDRAAEDECEAVSDLYDAAALAFGT